MVNSSTNDPSPVFNKHTKEGVWVEKLTDSLEAVTNRDMSLFLMWCKVLFLDQIALSSEESSYIAHLRHNVQFMAFETQAHLLAD